MRNGYPLNFINQLFLSFRKPKPLPLPKSTATRFLRFPFINEAIKRKAINILHRTNMQETIQFWFDSGPSTRRIFHPPKEKLVCSSLCHYCHINSKNKKQCHIKCTIYQINCSFCNQIYIGESFRPVWQRIKEHEQLSNKRDAVAQHFLSAHPSKSSISVSWYLLHRNLPTTSTRKTLESIYINRVDPDKLMNNCVGRELPFRM